MTSILRALVPLWTAVISIGLAWCFYESRPLAIASTIVAVLAILFGAAAYDFGVQSLPRHPVAALQLMEFYRVARVGVGALSGAAVIVATVELAGDSLKGADKQLLAAIATAVTSFLTALVGDWTGDASDEAFSNRVKESFQAAYGRRPASGPANPKVHYFAPGSAGERYVFSNDAPGMISGWDASARKKRADALAVELTSGASDG